ncbi:hypothetical protein ABPG74_005741 [Tetrahymena malaccensis]
MINKVEDFYQVQKPSLTQDNLVKVVYWHKEQLSQEVKILKKLTVSYLCHDEIFLNPLHVVLEPLEYNKGRNRCKGPGHCGNNPQCLISGEYVDSYKVINPYLQEYRPNAFSFKNQ